MAREKHCYDCKHAGMDMDMDPYCGHSKSFKEIPFGRSINYARREGNFCGPEAKLFEKKETVRAG